MALSLGSIAINAIRKLDSAAGPTEDNAAIGTMAELLAGAGMNLATGLFQSAVEGRPESAWSVLRNGDFERVTCTGHHAFNQRGGQSRRQRWLLGWLALEPRPGPARPAGRERLAGV
jgi:hypothetical protein